MRTGRITILLATIAFGLMVAFQFTATSVAPVSAGVGITQPNSGLPYD
jgi:hypothetical protein